jgi:superfamily II DNA or RNA helicase
MIGRYSSRRGTLAGFLPDALVGARSYDRIAGYFRSSILEVAGEALEGMAPDAPIRVICNSELHPLDVITARAAKAAMTREWTGAVPEDLPPALKARLGRLYGFLISGRLQVRVLADEHFGLVHGKGGVIKRADGSQLAFIGSANESLRAWKINYEIVWTDESPEGIAWVGEEFEALWRHPGATELADAVIQDVGRLARRTVIPGVARWREERAEAAAAAIELPVYRRENGLWAHQKHFVRLAFEQHRRGGARLVLADQVGLGKTVQLALAAKLMALWGGGRVLVLAPKALLQQWQGELWTLLRLPSAVWTGRGWEDEQGVFHPASGNDLQQCPRRVGIVSTGLVTQPTGAAEALAGLTYECVILDEAHRARRSNLGPTHRKEAAKPNNLLRFLWRIAERTTSLLLATATPVQLDPIEAWDLLDALNRGRGTVLGSHFSRWATRPREGLDLVLGRAEPPTAVTASWEWLRDPFPPREEGPNFAILRASLGMQDGEVWARPEGYERLGVADQRRVARLSRDFFQRHNPFIRHIVRRTREYLETTIDPQTAEPYLQPVRVRLFGEAEREAVPLTGLLRDAYEAAETFCEEVGKRPGMNSGFLKTILLRRMGSTVEAGRRTAEKLLGAGAADDDDEDGDAEDAPRSSLHPLFAAEREQLERCLTFLQGATGEDPKYREVERILLDGVAGSAPWLDEGCIVFTQYYDSARWVAGRLSERLPEEPIGVYTGAARSGLFRAGYFERLDREVLKEEVRRGAIRLLVGTDAASEGLNMQKIGTLINLDLPWNPTRLEQRKGRIQRIGQAREEVLLYNMRYRGSVEDRVHHLLSTRLASIHDLFGQLPDTLEDVWVAVALRDEERARTIIDAVPEQHPFALRYDRIAQVDWESCSAVLDSQSQLEDLLRGW